MQIGILYIQLFSIFVPYSYRAWLKGEGRGCNPKQTKNFEISPIKITFKAKINTFREINYLSMNICHMIFKFKHYQ